MQLPLGFLVPDSQWTPPELGSLPSWRGASRVAVDTETCDPFLKKLGPGVRRGAYICGYSFAIEDGPSFYVPVRHEGGGNVDTAQAFAYLREQANSFEGEIVGANLPYDIDHLAEEGVTFDRIKRFRDIQIADPLINELHRSYSMKAIAERYGVPGKDVELLERAASAFGVDPKGGLYKLHSRFVGPYGEQDVRLPLQLLRRQERLIDEQDLWQIYDLESDVMPLLVAMRRRGVAIDQARLEKVEEWSLREEAAALQIVKHQTGLNIGLGDVWKAGALAPALRHIGVELPKTSQGKDSITKDILSGVNHPVADAIQRARKVNKVRTTFAQSIRTYQTNGRIHCTFNQLRKTDEGDDSEKGAAYGRLSCEDPNMQQQPARDPEIGPMWRAIFRPDEGGEWGTFDFSQQEPKWLIDWAVKCGPRLLGTEAHEAAERAAQMFRDNPKTDSYDAFSEFSGLKRKEAKEVYLGRVYGMGTAKMARKLSLDTKWIFKRDGVTRLEVAGDEAQGIIDRFDGGVPYGKKMAKVCESRARDKGFITTYAGRRCRFPEGINGGYDFTHKALNRLIQGSSADQVKIAMLKLHEAGHSMQLQVHDELDTTVTSRRQAEEIAEIMINAVPMCLPMKVDIETGPSWGEIE